MTSHTLDQEQFRTHVKNQRHWVRLAYMLVFGVLLHIAGIVMWVLCALQFLSVLATGQDNPNLRAMGSAVTGFIQQALCYVSYNSEVKPFPFASWTSTNTNPSPSTHESEVSDGIIVEEEPKQQ